MNKKIILKLGISLLLLIQACSPLGETVNEEISDNFYYNKSKTDIIYSPMGNWFELGNTPLHADASTFKVLNEHLGKDKDSAYYREHAIVYPDFDFNTFTAVNADWMWHMGMDKNRVYSFSTDVLNGEWKLITRVIENADPSSFRQYDLNWGKDATQHFYNYEVISVDYASFEPVNETFAKDKNQIYLHYNGEFNTMDGDALSFEKIDDHYAKDSSNIYFFIDFLDGEKVERVMSIPFQNSRTIKVKEKNYLLVDDSVYYNGRRIPKVKASDITIISPIYAKDPEYVYYEDKIVTGADPATFHYDEKEYFYRDKNHKYQGDEVWLE